MAGFHKAIGNYSNYSTSILKCFKHSRLIDASRATGNHLYTGTSSYSTNRSTIGKVFLICFARPNDSQTAFIERISFTAAK